MAGVITHDPIQREEEFIFLGLIVKWAQSKTEGQLSIDMQLSEVWLPLPRLKSKISTLSMLTDPLTSTKST